MKIIDVKTGKNISCSIIVLTSNRVPKKKDNWNFDWTKAIKQNPESSFCLIDDFNKDVQGAVQIKYDDGMLIMEILEIAPMNIGKNRKFDNVAGCLIAFTCRQAIKIQSAYKGYVTFSAKTELIEWYKTKYGATSAIGQRMYIDPKTGNKLIKKYLES